MRQDPDGSGKKPAIALGIYAVVAAIIAGAAIYFMTPDTKRASSPAERTPVEMRE